MARGTFYLSLAEATFVVSGYIIHIGSKHILKIELYGLFGILLSLLTHYRIFLASGVNRAVSKYISEDPGMARVIRRQALKLQVVLGILLCALVWVIAPWFARLWQRDDLVSYIRLTGFALPIFGVYSVYRGSLNGFKLFGKEALVEIVYSLLKVLLLFALIFPLGLYGAVLSYLLGTLAALVVACLSIPRGDDAPGRSFPIMRIVEFAVPVLLFSFILSLLQTLDLYFVRAQLPAVADGRETGYAGFYTCAQQFAKIPYMMLYALSLTLFPNIAASTARAGNEKLTASSIRRALRAGLMVVLPFGALLSASGPALVGWIYGADSVSGGEALRILIFGHIFLSFLMVLTTILTASGRPWLSFILVAGTLAIDALLNYLLVPSHGILGAAAATTAAAAAGMLISAALVFSCFRCLIAPRSAARIIAASALLYGATRWMNPTRWLIPPIYLLLGGAYLLLLLVLREIDKEDGKMVASIFKR